MTIFGKSRDLKTKTPKTQTACIFLRWNKFQKVECIQMDKLTHGYIEMYFIEKVITSQKLYDVITFLIMQITANQTSAFASECTLPLGICSIEERRSLLAGGYWGFHRGNRSLIERHLGFLRRSPPGTSGRVQKSREGEGEGREKPPARKPAPLE